MTEDRNDYLAAFAIGAIVGIGATLLLAPQRSGAKRVMYEIEPALERARKGTRRVGHEASDVAREFGKRGGRALRAVSDEAWRAAQRRVRKARQALRNRR